MARTKPARPSGQLRARVPAVAVAIVTAGLAATQVTLFPQAASAFRLGKSVAAMGLLGLAITVWLAATLTSGKLKLPRSPVLMTAGLYPMLLAVSAFWAANPERTMVAAVTAAVWVMTAALVGSLEKETMARVARWVVAAGVVSAGVGLLQMAGVSPFELWRATGRKAVTGLAGNPADLAIASLLVVPLALMCDVNRRRRWSLVLAAGILVAVIIPTQTKAALVALVAEAVVLALVIVRQRVSRAVRWCSVLLLIALLSGAWMAAPRLRRTAHLFEKEDLLAATLRAPGWTAALSMIGDRPLLGVGGANYTSRYTEARLAWLEGHDAVRSPQSVGGHFVWAHCDLLQVVAELGGVGWLWMALLVAVLVRARFWRHAHVAVASAGLLPFAVFHFPGHLAVALGPLAVYLGVIIRGEAESRRPLTVGARHWPQIIGITVVAVAICLHAELLTLDVFRGSAEATLRALRVREVTLEKEQQARLMRDIEQRATNLFGRRVGEDPWLWRLIGRARLARGAAGEAEDAFRTSMSVSLHEENLLGLGLALAAQGERNMAIPYLMKACRLSPGVARFIRDQSLREAVERALAPAQRSAAGRK